MDPKWVELKATGARLVDILEANGEKPVPAYILAAHLRLTLVLVEAISAMSTNMRALSDALLREQLMDTGTIQ